MSTYHFSGSGRFKNGYPLLPDGVAPSLVSLCFQALGFSIPFLTRGPSSVVGAGLNNDSDGDNDDPIDAIAATAESYGPDREVS